MTDVRKTSWRISDSECVCTTVHVSDGFSKAVFSCTAIEIIDHQHSAFCSTYSSWKVYKTLKLSSFVSLLMLFILVNLRVLLLVIVWTSSAKVFLFFFFFFFSAVSTHMEGDEKIQVLLMVERGRYSELDTLSAQSFMLHYEVLVNIHYHLKVWGDFKCLFFLFVFWKKFRHI